MFKNVLWNWLSSERSNQSLFSKKIILLRQVEKRGSVARYKRQARNYFRQNLLKGPPPPWATILHHALSDYISSLGLFISTEIFCNARNDKVSRRNEIKSNLQRIFLSFQTEQRAFSLWTYVNVYNAVHDNMYNFNYEDVKFGYV